MFKAIAQMIQREAQSWNTIEVEFVPGTFCDEPVTRVFDKDSRMVMTERDDRTGRHRIPRGEFEARCSRTCGTPDHVK